MEAKYIAWALCLFVFANVVDISEGYTCSYYDYSGDKMYLYCSYNAYCCGPTHDRYCCGGSGTIVGAVVGSIVFIIIVASVISCCCCACCPAYRYRSRGTITTTNPGQGYNTMPHTTVNVDSGPYTAKPAGAYTGPPPSYQS